MSIYILSHNIQQYLVKLVVQFLFLFLLFSPQNLYISRTTLLEYTGTQTVSQIRALAFPVCFKFTTMASLDTDVTMVPAGEGSGGAGPSSSTVSTSSSTRKAKRFEIKKWNAVALWAWGIIKTLTLCIVYIFMCLFVTFDRVMIWYVD